MTAAPSTSPESPLTADDLASCGYQLAIARDLVEQQCAAMERTADTVDTVSIDRKSNQGE